jgi:hypothetical protein
MKVMTVMRSGGEYKPEHVIRLRDQVMMHLPGADFWCLADCDVPGVQVVPMPNLWPGWWSKMNLFDPAIEGPILFMDLDTSIVGDMAAIAGVDRLAIMRDVYRPAGLQSSLMFLPEDSRRKVWECWIDRPTQWMGIYHRGGDQAFLERFWLERAARWQDILPGQVVSYKAHVRKAVRKDREFGDGNLPEGARVVCFHGKPRPWEIGW